MPVISCALVLAVAACGGNNPVDKKAANTAGLPDINAAAPTATGEPHARTAPAQAAPAPQPAVKVPAALQGRWGLTPADCTTALGDAKGLLVINSDELRFYESRAVPAADADFATNSISGNFAFSGEGQSWTKYEALKIDNGRLTRTETKPTASFSYAKCS
ncbi:MAG: hypothetical protein ACJ8FS_03100 [Sphingomicrobium sp.]